MTPPEVWADRHADSRPDHPGWSVRVVPNKYPALTSDPPSSFSIDQQSRSMPAVGVHEVIIESPDHLTNPALLNEGDFARILRAYRERIGNLRRDQRWRYVLVYKNQGDRAGATLEHIHSQLIALPFIPKQAEIEIANARTHHERTGRCIYCAMIQRELEEQRRIVATDERFIALCPYAPRFAFETWILPRSHAAAYERSDDDSIAALAGMLKQIVRRLDRLHKNPPFNYLMQSLPLDKTNGEHYHWHVELLPQLTRAAGFEWGSGFHINPVAPEEAARLLRNALI
jgi:UDPglucose--hexose-1-phosphate uridylyltransferase